MERDNEHSMVKNNLDHTLITPWFLIKPSITTHTHKSHLLKEQHSNGHLNPMWKEILI